MEEDQEKKQSAILPPGGADDHVDDDDDNDDALPSSPPKDAAATTKKPRKKELIDRKLVNGVRLRTCICKDPLCATEMRRWAQIGLVNQHRANYVVLPVYQNEAKKTTSVDRAKYSNAYLQRCLVHIKDISPEEAQLIMQQQHAVKTGKQVRAKFVAHRHFDPRMIYHLNLRHGQRKIPVNEKHNIPAYLATLLDLSEEDRCVHYNEDDYFAVPTYKNFTRDLENEIKKQEAPSQVQTELDLKIKEVAEKDEQILELQQTIQKLKEQQAGTGEAQPASSSVGRKRKATTNDDEKQADNKRATTAPASCLQPSYTGGFASFQC